MNYRFVVDKYKYYYLLTYTVLVMTTKLTPKKCNSTLITVCYLRSHYFIYFLCFYFLYTNTLKQNKMAATVNHLNPFYSWMEATNLPFRCHFLFRKPKRKANQFSFTLPLCKTHTTFLTQHNISFMLEPAVLGPVYTRLVNGNAGLFTVFTGTKKKKMEKKITCLWNCCSNVPGRAG